MQHSCTTRTRRADRMIALIMTLLVLCTAASRLNYDCDWGDDFAAYLNDGIAIAEGRYDEQIKLNYRMHPTPHSQETREGELVYVWGYPLMLSLVYRLVGFDRVSFRCIPYYKLVSVFSTALSAGLLYLFFQRRLSRSVSVFLCAWISFHIIQGVDSLASDQFFFFLMMLCLVLLERFLEDLDSPSRKEALRGFVLGLVMLAVYETRLNGSSICALAAVLQLSYWLVHRRQTAVPVGESSFRRMGWIPWIAFALLLLLCRFFVLHPATKNTLDLTMGNWENTRRNTEYYLYTLRNFFLDRSKIHVPWTVFRILRAALIFLMLLGIAKNIRKDWAILPYALFCAVYFVTLVILPYAQGLRYCYPILPPLTLFLGSGAEQAASILLRRLKANTKTLVRRTCFLVSCLLCCVMAFNHFKPDLFRMLSGEEVRNQGAYSAQAVEVYRYIMDNTPEDSVIAFRKPRALFLNTQREAFSHGVNGNEERHRDYYLICTDLDAEAEKRYLSTYGENSREVFSNDLFTLFQIDDEGDASNS